MLVILAVLSVHCELWSKNSEERMLLCSHVSVATTTSGAVLSIRLCRRCFLLTIDLQFTFSTLMGRLGRGLVGEDVRCGDGMLELIEAMLVMLESCGLLSGSVGASCMLNRMELLLGHSHARQLQGTSVLFRRL